MITELMVFINFVLICISTLFTNIVIWIMTQFPLVVIAGVQDSSCGRLSHRSVSGSCLPVMMGDPDNLTWLAMWASTTPSTRYCYGMFSAFFQLLSMTTYNYEIVPR